MRKVAPILVLRLALLVAIFACAVLFVEYENAGDPAFCGVGSGCMAVRRSRFSTLAEVPLPLIGLCAEAGLYALVLVAREKSHTFFVTVAAAGAGAVGVGLIGLQAFKIGAFCKWCLLVDVSAILAALAAVEIHLQASRSEAYEAFLDALARRRAQVVAWAGGAALLAALPFVWAEYPVVPPAPPAIAAVAVPGKVTIVSFTDFQCPHCRKLAPVLHEIQDNWGDRMALVRKMVPLKMHPGAMPAALAYVCAPEAQREAMAQRLYAAPPQFLTRDGVGVIAHDLHLDEGAFARCVDGAEGQQAIAADQALFDALDVGAVPFTYIGQRGVVGNDAEAARKIGHEVMEGDRPSLPLSWLLAVALAVALALGAMTVFLAPKGEERVPAPSS